MRMQPDADVIAAMRADPLIREMIKSLYHDPTPEWATFVDPQYEFACSGHWFAYVIDEAAMETVIRIVLIETPSFI